MHPEVKSKLKGCLGVTIALAILLLLSLCVLFFPFYTAYKDEPNEKSSAIARAELLTQAELKQLVSHARSIVAGAPYSLEPRTSGLMWDETYGFPKELEFIKPLRINVVSDDEVWFAVHKVHDSEVVLSVVDLSSNPKVILLVGLDRDYRFSDKRELYEE